MRPLSRPTAFQAMLPGCQLAAASPWPWSFVVPVLVAAAVLLAGSVACSMRWAMSVTSMPPGNVLPTVCLQWDMSHSIAFAHYIKPSWVNPSRLSNSLHTSMLQTAMHTWQCPEGL